MAVYGDMRFIQMGRRWFMGTELLPGDLERKRRKLKELEEAQILDLERKQKYISENRVLYFQKFEGQIDPNKTLLIPKQNLKQARLLDGMRDPSKMVFTYTGANRTGKTSVWASVVPCYCAGKWLWDDEPIFFTHNKPRKIRIVGQDWERHVKTVVIPALQEWWPSSRQVEIKKNSLGVDAFWIDIKTGSTIEILSNRQESELFEGWHGDLIIYDEPPKRDVRVACARGLIDRNGKELFCMTLLKEAWVDREVIKAVDKDGKPDRSVLNVHAVIQDNVGYGITLKGVEQFMKTCNADEIQARIHGVPSYMSGLVYPQFKREYKPDGHLVERFKVPSDWLVDIAIDIHPRKPQAILFRATAQNNYRYLCYEIYDYGDGKWVGEEIVRIVRNNLYRVNEVIIDPLAKGDSNQDDTTYDKIATILMRHDMVLRVASKDKDSGIISVKDQLKGPNNEPSLFIFDDLKRTIMEIQGYMYEDKGERMGKPSKEDDDMMENLYRLSLIDTVWYPADSADIVCEDPRGRDKMTGY